MPVPRRDSTSVRSLQQDYQRYITATNDLYNWSRDWPLIMRGQTTQPSGLEYSRAAQWLTYLKEKRTIVTEVAAISGIEQYASDQVNDQTLNLATEHSAFLAAMDACRDWLITNLPTNIDFVESIGVDGTVTYARATAAQVEPLAVLMDAFNATIDA